VTTLNLYKPPTVVPGDRKLAGRWLDLVKKLFPDDHERIVQFFAHRVQRPEEKINFALVLIGAPGIGKDTILEPLKYAVGPHNFREVSPPQLLGRFNSYLKAVVIRISEARDLGEFNRYQLYERMKIILASPPDMLRVDEKNVPEYEVVNCCGVVVTSNHLTDGIFLPPDDRRHFVVKSDLTKDDFEGDFWNALWEWYHDGGIQHVASYLATLDLRTFNGKAPPPKTAAFWAIVDSNRSPEEPELEDAIDKLGRPNVVTLDHVIGAATTLDFHLWLEDRKNRRAIPHRFEKVGYIPVRNPDADSGLWRLDGTRQVLYAQVALTPAERLAAAKELRDDVDKAAKKREADKAAAEKEKEKHAAEKAAANKAEVQKCRAEIQKCRAEVQKAAAQKAAAQKAAAQKAAAQKAAAQKAAAQKAARKTHARKKPVRSEKPRAGRRQWQ
jgi:hypothetical protein